MGAPPPGHVVSGSLLDRIVLPGGLSVVFQPVFQLRPAGWHLVAFEALVRGPQDTHLKAAEVLFAYGRRKHAEAELDRACLRAIVAAAASLGSAAPLNLNVHGITLEKDRTFAPFLMSLLSAAGVTPSAITLEIVEHSASSCDEEFAATLAELREAGIRIALDDIGLGQSNYKMIVETRPDCFKIDRWLVNGCARDRYRRAVLRSLADLAVSFGGVAVAEGIDNVDDLRAVLAEGITTVQGFLLGRPAAACTFGACDRVRHAARLLPRDPGPSWAPRSNWIADTCTQLDRETGTTPVAQVA